MIDIHALNLPRHIHATVLTGTDVTTGEQLAYPVIWADRTERNCPRCDQPIEVEVPCPVMLDTGAGQGGRVTDLSQQHGCGEWLGVSSATFDEFDTTQQIEAEAHVLAEARAEEINGEREYMRRRLGAYLRTSLQLRAEPLEDGETQEDRDDEVTTGGEYSPGVYHDGTQWVAWDYDPDPDGDETDVITVTAKDLEA